MHVKFDNIDLRRFNETSLQFEPLGSGLVLSHNSNVKDVLLFCENTHNMLELAIKDSCNITRCSSKSVIVYPGRSPSYMVSFPDCEDALKFMNLFSRSSNDGAITSRKSGLSHFDERTDSWSAVQYFQFYSYLSQQQNMMQDYIRTSTYQSAILANAGVDFNGKVVLDVGAGSGILSFFAVQAGAKRVYAVEASNMAGHCEALVKANKLAGRIVVVSGKIEDITLPEPVDVIISEPMGYMLYNERMLETYVHARKFLAPRHQRHRIRNQTHPQRRSEETKKAVVAGGENGGGDLEMRDVSEVAAAVTSIGGAGDGQEGVCAEPKPGVMFPSVGKLFVAPFSDEALFAEQYTKANFWYQQSFHGMDLSALRGAAIKEYFNQPVVDTFDIGICPVAEPCVHEVDFRTVSESELANIDIQLKFRINQFATIHGLAFWFDVGFLGSQKDVWLSTAPTEPLTHWYQVRCLLGTALFVQEGQILTGRVKMVANTRQSYDVELELVVPDTDTKITNQLDLKNPHFRYTGYPQAPPPGSHTKCPTEVYFAQQQQQQAATNTATTGALNPQSSGATVSLIADPAIAATMLLPNGGGPFVTMSGQPSGVLFPPEQQTAAVGVGCTSLFPATTATFQNHTHQPSEAASPASSSLLFGGGGVEASYGGATNGVFCWPVVAGGAGVPQANLVSPVVGGASVMAMGGQSQVAGALASPIVPNTTITRTAAVVDGVAAAAFDPNNHGRPP